MFEVRAIDVHGDADFVDDSCTREGAVDAARSIVRDGDAPAAVVEHNVRGARKVVAYYGDYAALRRGAWIDAENVAVEPMIEDGDEWKAGAE
jgi:hypothetical protein